MMTKSVPQSRNIFRLRDQVAAARLSPAPRVTFFLALFAAGVLFPCTGPQLTGTFTVVRGSAGAGNIIYALTLRNKSTNTCFVSGTPQVKLLDKRGRPQATKILPAHPGAQTAVLVTLKPGAKTKATARFSPDVPGVGEGHIGKCEPTSYTLLVTPNGGGSVRVPIRPPTPVCEHGQLQLSVYTITR